MNYKSGDLVTVIGNCNYHRFRIGETVRLEEKDGSDWRSESLKSGKCWWVRESDMKPFKPATMPQKIVITTDGKTTLARLFDGKTMVKRAEAKCAPSDTFNFNTGANLAFNRLVYGTDYNPQDVAIKTNAAPAESEPEPVKLYCVKDYEPGIWLTKGKVYTCNPSDNYAIQYDANTVRHGHLNRRKIGGTPLTDLLVPLVRRPAKVGEWVYIIRNNGGPVMHGTIWKVAEAHIYNLAFENGLCCDIENYLVLDGYHGDLE